MHKKDGRLRKKNRGPANLNFGIYSEYFQNILNKYQNSYRVFFKSLTKMQLKCV